MYFEILYFGYKYHNIPTFLFFSANLVHLCRACNANVVHIRNKAIDVCVLDSYLYILDVSCIVYGSTCVSRYVLHNRFRELSRDIWYPPITYTVCM